MEKVFSEEMNHQIFAFCSFTSFELTFTTGSGCIFRHENFFHCGTPTANCRL